MPRPEPRMITFTVDGRDVQAPENAMLVDAAKLGDAMAMPIGSMVQKFRSELEAEIEAARERAGAGALSEVIPIGVADEYAGPAG